ncbi:MAG: (Fe-S)-binding protein [Firmicutes bacterium]|nr:(Fe-S)-binding protein [Bacillota bacterium]
MALKDFIPMQERCSNCSFCKWIPFDKVKSVRFAENCPAVVHGGFNTYAARGRFQMGLAIAKGELDYTDEMARITHECLDCGACDVACKVCRYNLEPLDHNRELKHDALLKGHILPAQLKMLDAFNEEKTLVVGAKKADRTKWAEGIEWAKKPEVLFFPGCKYSYDKKLQKTARNAAQLLLKAGVKLGYLGDAEMCCAGRLYQMGFFEQFDKRAGANIKAIENSGVKTIVTPCSDCYHAFKRLYAAKGLKVEVLHVVEYLDRMLKEGTLKFTKAIDLTVTYHDPCHLGRQGEPYEAWEGHEKKILNQVHTWEPRRPRYNGSKGIYEEPRNILRAIPGVKLVEMERIKEYSWCCGAGSGCSVTDKEFSEWTAKERIEEANSTGAEALVTACPWCKDNFEKAGGIKVVDIIDLALKAL